MEHKCKINRGNENKYKHSINDYNYENTSIGNYSCQVSNQVCISFRLL